MWCYPQRTSERARAKKRYPTVRMSVVGGQAIKRAKRARCERQAAGPGITSR